MRQNQTGNHTHQTESFEQVMARVMGKIENRTFDIQAGPEREFYSDSAEGKGTPEEPWPGKSMGVPRLYGGCSFDSFNGNNKLIDTLKLLAKDGSNVVLRGPTGSGKTHLAISMLLSHGAGRFITVPDLLLNIRSSFGEDGRSEEEIVNSYTWQPLLILDDLGAEKPTEYSVTTLYIVIDRRVRDMRKTIITTNLEQGQIEATFGARIASRLAGMENIKINMPDWRKKR
jgi:DNA replication protein DnaC